MDISLDSVVIDVPYAPGNVTLDVGSSLGCKLLSPAQLKQLETEPRTASWSHYHPPELLHYAARGHAQAAGEGDGEACAELLLPDPSSTPMKPPTRWEYCMTIARSLVYNSRSTNCGISRRSYHKQCNCW